MQAALNTIHENEEEEEEASFLDVAHSTMHALQNEANQEYFSIGIFSIVIMFNFSIFTVHMAEDKTYDDDNDDITLPPELPPPYVIEFEVPCGKFMRDLLIKNIRPWSLFQTDVVELMNGNLDT